MAYAPCRVVTSISGTEVRIREITEYPFDERIRLEVEMDSDRPLGFPVDLRIPSWAGKGLSVSVNGQEQKDIVPGTVLRLDREWQDGDSVVLYFPMEISIGRWYENAAAVERGPLVYCAEWADNQFDVMHFALDMKPQFTIADAPTLAGGVKKLTATGTLLATGADGRLTATRRVATLIPYYAWCHRGPGRMQVWLAAGTEAMEEGL